MTARAPRWGGTALVVVLALAASAGALANGFAFDDTALLAGDARIHDLARWRQWWTAPFWPGRAEPSLWRPLATTLFAVQWAAAGGAPWLFHLVGVLAYAGVTALAFRLAALALPTAGAVAAAAWFAVHPVHVEVTANAVGQTELLAALAVVGALAGWVRARRSGPVTAGALAAVVALVAAGALLKEHALLLPLYLLLADLTLVAPEARAADRRAPVRLVVACVVVGVLVVGGRLLVLGSAASDTPHPALAGRPWAERLAILVALAPEKVRLLLWPARLYADYSPAQVAVRPVPGAAHLPGIACHLVAAAAVAWSWRRHLMSPTPRRALVAFAAAALAAALAPTAVGLHAGPLVAERTLFLPSLFAAMLVGAAAAWTWEAPRGLLRASATAGFVVLLALGLGRSIARIPAWRDDERAFRTLVADAPDNYKGHYALGSWYFQRDSLAQGEREWRLAIALFPEFVGPAEQLAWQYRRRGRCDAAVPLFRDVLARHRPRTASSVGLIDCLLEADAAAAAAAAADEARRALAEGRRADLFAPRLAAATARLRGAP